MPFVRSITNLPAGKTEDSYSGEPCEVCEQEGGHVHFTPQSEYPNYNPNNTLAQIIVDAWRDDPPGFRTQLLSNPDGALRAKGLFLVKPRVMTHADYKKEVILEKKVLDEGRMVLVLPDAPENLPAGADLLDSARAAMAYTPVGI